MNLKIKALIGVVIVGIILISGKSVWGNQSENVQASNSIVQSVEKVIIVTDKVEYKSKISVDDHYIRGESIKIIVTNNLKNDIYFDSGSVIPFTSLYFEIYKDEKWKTYDEMCGVAEYPFDFTFKKWLQAAVRLKPGERIIFERGLDHSVDFNLFEGEYRFRLEYYPNCALESLEIDTTDYSTFRFEKAPNCFAKVYSDKFKIIK
ncbi:MAG: hypothetical protein V1670_04830 [Candidatus Omnitrophota bacterium]